MFRGSLSPATRRGSRLPALGAAALLSLTLGMFLLYEGPFSRRSAGPVVVAAVPLPR